MEDKWVGLILAILGSLAIGSSFIVTKMGLISAARRAGYNNASDELTYLKNPIWWAGMTLMVVGEIGNFAAYAFAPPVLVTPLGALAVLIGAILASVFLKEELGRIGRVGCALCLVGSIIIVLHAPEDRDITTVDEILHFALQPGFLLYCFTVLVVSLVLIYVVSPKHGKTNPVVYLSICSLVGSVSIMAIKGFGVALKLTFNGHNQLTHPSTYVFGIVTAVCIVVQMNYFNKALDIFSTNVVNPIYYVGFSTATIVASLILFQGFDTTDGINTTSLIGGFIVTFLGVYLLNISRTLPSPSTTDGPHDPLEDDGPLAYPRLSLSGHRRSLDSTWSPSAARGGHSRRGSQHRGLNGGSGWRANGDLEHGSEEMILQELTEEDEDEETDERAALRGKEREWRKAQEAAKGVVGLGEDAMPGEDNHRTPPRIP